MIEAILNVIREGTHFVVASHAHPDGDAIASTLALANFLREIGKQAVAFNIDSVPEELQFLPGAHQLVSDRRQLGRYDVGFVLDSGELDRAGGLPS